MLFGTESFLRAKTGDFWHNSVPFLPDFGTLRNFRENLLQLPRFLLILDLPTEIPQWEPETIEEVKRQAFGAVPSEPPPQCARSGRLRCRFSPVRRNVPTGFRPMFGLTSFCAILFAVSDTPKHDGHLADSD